MSIARLCRAALLVAASVITLPGAAQENPLAQPSRPAQPPAGEPVNPLVGVKPAAAPLPAWLKRGARVTYLSSSALVPGEARVLVPDAKGDWVGPDGRRFAVGDARGTGSMSFDQYTVVAADDRVVAADVKMFLLRDADPAGRCVVSTSRFVSGSPEGLLPIWTPPAKLAAMKEGEAAGVKVTKGPFPLNGKTYNAVTHETRTGRGFDRTTADLDTGLVLVYQFSRTGGQSAVAGPGGVSRAGAGTTSVGTVTLAGLRQLDLPWPEDGFTNWAAGRTLEYRGVHQTFVPNTQPFEQAFAVSVGLGQPGQGWVPAKMTQRMAGLAGAAPMEQASDRAASPMTTSPYWIDPAALAKLKPGQAVDADPVTRFTAKVAEAGGGRVVIVDEGQVDRTTSVYDTASGALVAVTVEQRQEVGATRTQLRLDAAK
ncbi:MAG TPA: hypothetical protein VF796_08665 [Humisphaera sp.]